MFDPQKLQFVLLFRANSFCLWLKECWYSQVEGGEVFEMDFLFRSANEVRVGPGKCRVRSWDLGSTLRKSVGRGERPCPLGYHHRLVSFIPIR